MVRILIVEDQRIMQKYFESIIMREPEFRHVQTVSDACEAVRSALTRQLILCLWMCRHFIIMMG